jgi:nucleoside-diphosphate-sugar epimerase
MTNILITGATGNVGIEVITALKQIMYPITMCAGVRDKKLGNEKLVNFKVKTIQFDFTNSVTFHETFFVGGYIHMF